MEQEKFTAEEMLLVNTISVTLGLRLLAMMIVMPLMSGFAKEITGSTPFLSGLALGVFGLMQAIFQFPFGKWSDKYGRKKMVIFGMVLLFIGLVIAGISDNIYLLIVGRAVQGCGGINAVAYAWIGDTIDEKKRNNAMGILGITGGIAAILGFILGPLLYQVISVSSIFYICAVFVGIASVYIGLFINGQKKKFQNSKIIRLSAKENLKDKNVLKLDFAVFLMSYTMTALFYIFPLLVESSIGISGLWKILVPSTAFSIIVMRKMVKKVSDEIFNIMGMVGFFLIFLCGLFILADHILVRALGMLLYMGGYLYLTTMLPSGVTKLAKKENMGEITGMFNMMQYIGSFFGGICSGALWNINPLMSVWAIIIVSFMGGLIMKTIKLKTANDD